MKAPERPREHHSLANRVVFLVTAGVLALVVHAWATIGNASIAESALAEIVESDVPALRAADAFSVATHAANDHALRFVVAREPAWREARTADRGRVLSTLSVMRGAADSADTVSAVAEIEQVLPLYLAVVDAIFDASPETPMPLVVERASALLDRLHELSARFAAPQIEDLERSRRALLRRLSRARWSVFTTLAAVGLTSFLLALLLWKRVVGPLRGLREVVAALGRGELGTRAEVRGHDEVADFAAALNRMAVQLARERAQLLAISTTDALTGLANRRHFERHLEVELARAGRTSRSLSLLVFDIDRFKVLNDTHGHQAGDKVLVAVARTIAAELRPADLVARVGGEEFAVVLAETSLPTAAQVAERLRAAVEGTVCAPTGPDGKAAPITISIGATTCTGGVSPEELFAAADAAMYRAKETGRNRVVCAPGTAIPTG